MSKNLMISYAATLLLFSACSPELNETPPTAPPESSPTISSLEDLHKHLIILDSNGKTIQTLKVPSRVIKLSTSAVNTTTQVPQFVAPFPITSLNSNEPIALLKLYLRTLISGKQYGCLVRLCIKKEDCLTDYLLVDLVAEQNPLNLRIGFSASLATAATGTLQIIPIYASPKKRNSRKLLFSETSTSALGVGPAVNTEIAIAAGATMPVTTNPETAQSDAKSDTELTQTFENVINADSKIETGTTLTVSNNGKTTIDAAPTITPAPVATPTYSIGGSIKYLKTSGLVLQNNGNYSLGVDSGVTNFVFGTKFVAGATYAITVSTQPTGQTCTVSNNTGTLSNSNLTSVSISCSMNIKKMFITTNASIQGDMGATLTGIPGADSLCANDLNNPQDGPYKAFIVDDSARVACTTTDCQDTGIDEHADWILAANTTYFRRDGITEIGVTNSIGLFTFPLTNSFDSSDYSFWSGITEHWRTDTEHCSAWTSIEAGQHSSRGRTFYTIISDDEDASESDIPQTGVNSIVSAAGVKCNIEHHLLCVAQ